MSYDETEKIASGYDESACEFCERYKRSGLSRSSRILMDFMVDEGIYKMSVLDLGCGAGSFSIEMLKHGCGSSVGIDLSPKMVEAASRLAAENGFRDRAKFQTGNVATLNLPSSDIVVMDKVICCYSDVETLLRNAAGTSRNLVGLVVPRDEGIVSWPLRLGVWIGNLVQKRRGGLPFYLHSLDALDTKMRDYGFTRRKKLGSRLWLAFLYKRVGPLDPSH